MNYNFKENEKLQLQSKMKEHATQMEELATNFSSIKQELENIKQELQNTKKDLEATKHTLEDITNTLRLTEKQQKSYKSKAMAYEKQYEACHSDFLLLEGTLKDTTEQISNQLEVIASIRTELELIKGAESVEVGSTTLTFSFHTKTGTTMYRTCHSQALLHTVNRSNPSSKNTKYHQSSA